MTRWHDTALDWESPLDPSPWSKEEDVKFSKAVSDIATQIRTELGPKFEIVNEHSSVYECRLLAH